MSRRRARTLGALAGLAAIGAALAGCGSSNRLLPTSSAAALQNDFAMVEQYTAEGNCRKALGFVNQANIALAALPASVNAGLRAQLAAGVQDLTTAAASQCAQNAVGTSSSTTRTASSTRSSSVTSVATTTSSTITTATTTPTTSATTPVLTTSTPGPGGVVAPTTTTSAAVSSVPGAGQGGNGQGGAGNGVGGVGAP